MSPFTIEVWDAGRVRVNAAFADVLRRNGLTTFDAFMNFTGGETARQIGPRVTAKIALADGDDSRNFFIKRHGRAKLRDWIKPLLRLGRPILGARNEWDAILRFHAAGVPTMTPVAMGEFRGRSFLVTQSLEGCHNLLELVRETAVGQTFLSAEPVIAAGRQECLPHVTGLSRLIGEVARIARTMHRAGLHHQDFYLNHMLLPDGATSPHVRVIDLGRARQKRRLASRWIVKDLAQLDFSARSLSCRDRLRFLRAYLGRPLRRDDKRLIRRIWFKSQHIARHTARHRL